jgi:hypothetical protein
MRVRRSAVRSNGLGAFGKGRAVSAGAFGVGEALEAYAARMFLSHAHINP